MTTDQLERELETLAKAREDDERLRSAIRARLGEQVLVRPRPRRSLWLRFGWAPAAAAAMAAAIVSFGWPGGSGGPSAADAAIVRHALAAITSPANAIVHVKETGVQDGTPVGVEWWQETSPPYALRMIKGYAGRAVESAVASAPGPVDAIAPVREQLRRGDADVEGTTTIDGATLYKIKLSSGVIAYFDKTDYKPVYLDNPQHGGSTVRTRVVTYEELPMTPDNMKLLTR